jgi:hypothetical protein
MSEQGKFLEFHDLLRIPAEIIYHDMTRLRLTDPRVAESQGGGACPEQHEGRLRSGEFFYFRYRHGWASVTLGDRPQVYGPPRSGMDSPGFLAEEGMSVGSEMQGSFYDDDELRNRTFTALLDRLGR